MSSPPSFAGGDDGGDFVHGSKALQSSSVPLLRPALRAVHDFVWGTRAPAHDRGD
jgi:hypothetical protein